MAVLAAAVLAGVILGGLEGLIGKWFSLFLLFPALVGGAAGWAASGMVQRYKVRAPALVLLLGFLGGAAGYATDHAVRYVRFRSEIAQAMKRDGPAASDSEIAAKIDEELISEVGAPGVRGFLALSARAGVRIKHAGSSDDTAGPTFTGTAAWIVWAIELLIAAGIAAGLAWSRARDPFCEACETWYGPASIVATGGPGDKATKNQLTAALETGDVDAAARSFFTPRDARARAVFQLTAATCPRCDGDAYCQLDRVMTKKRAQQSKLATWLMSRAELQELTGALGRAQPRVR